MQTKKLLITSVLALVILSGIVCLLLISGNTNRMYINLQSLHSKTTGEFGTLISQKLCYEEDIIVVKNSSHKYFTTKHSAQENARYKTGKDLIYESLYKCKAPKMLDGYKSPCWRGESGSPVCIGRVVLLGFHKCGTSDLAKWFYNYRYSSITADYFQNGIGDMCPAESIEKADLKHSGVVTANSDTTVYGGCPGCLVINQVLRRDTHSIVLHSAVQYLHQLQTDDTRYIITMRNPTDRVLSHYFYFFKTNAKDNYVPWQGKNSPEEIGNGLLHELVTTALAVLEKCLEEDGVSYCILTAEPGNIAIYGMINSIITQSCYAPYIKEALKFIPKEMIYFSRMEDYASQPELVVPEIFSFIGESLEDTDISRLAANRRNIGVTSKPVLKETIDLLDRFFVPFNVELAQFLEDEKWLFKRS